MTHQLDDLTFHLNRLFGRVGRVVGGAVLAFLA